MKYPSVHPSIRPSIHRGQKDLFQNIIHEFRDKGRKKGEKSGRGEHSEWWQTSHSFHGHVLWCDLQIYMHKKCYQLPLSHRNRARFYMFSFSAVRVFQHEASRRLVGWELWLENEQMFHLICYCKHPDRPYTKQSNVEKNAVCTLWEIFAVYSKSEQHSVIEERDYILSLYFNIEMMLK